MQLNSMHEKIKEWNYGTTSLCRKYSNAYQVFHVLIKQLLRPGKAQMIEMGSATVGSYDITTAWLLFQNKEKTNMFYANCKLILLTQKLIFLSLQI